MKLLCTDLDRTLLPNGEQAESASARPVLWHLLDTFNCALAYVSGRDIDGVVQAIEEYDLAVPQFIAADVGSLIYEQKGDEWVVNTDWTNSILANWNGGNTQAIKALFKDLPELQDQEEANQSLFKRSYYYDETLNEAELKNRVQATLQSKGIEASLVCSHDPEKGVGLLDILPSSATKREAVAFLQSRLDLATEDVLFSGDSGNDVDAISGPNPTVLVANADETTVSQVRKRASLDGNEHTIYLASGGTPVHGQEPLNGNYAAGIVEGLLHFRPSWRPLLLQADWVESACANRSSSSNDERRKSA